MIQVQKLLAIFSLACTTAICFGQLTVPGTTGAGAGSDGDFAPTANITIDLSLATDRASVKWDADNKANKGNGIYDREKWAVVFKYASVNIPAGVTVTFKGNRSNAPVVWLVQGDVKISGRVDLSGSSAAIGRAVGGPGGFSGGFLLPSSSGFGIGGGEGNSMSGFGNYAGGNSAGVASIYGNERIIPLIGGSGGTTQPYDAYASGPTAGGGGGGAILVASPSSINIDGSLVADGGLTNSSIAFNGGSGGAIRMVSNTISGTGTLRANATFGYGNYPGRLRLEGNALPLSTSGVFSQSPSLDRPGAIAQIWPDPTQPIVSITKVLAGTNTTDVPQDPNASFAFPLQDVSLTYDGEVTVVIETLNVPATDPGKWRVQLRVTPRSGKATLIDATLVPGSVVGAAAVWQAKFTFPAGISAMQAHAIKG